MCSLLNGSHSPFLTCLFSLLSSDIRVSFFSGCGSSFYQKLILSSDVLVVPCIFYSLILTNRRRNGKQSKGKYYSLNLVKIRVFSGVQRDFLPSGGHSWCCEQSNGCQQSKTDETEDKTRLVILVVNWYHSLACF